MLSLLVCIRVYRLDTVSLVGFFDPALWTIAPLTYFLVHLPPPPPPPKSKYSMYRQCVAGRGWGCWVVLETIFGRSLSLFFRPDSEPTKLLDDPKQKPERGGGLRQINTCRKVPLQVNFLDNDSWHCFLLVYFFHGLKGWRKRGGRIHRWSRLCSVVVLLDTAGMYGGEEGGQHRVG